MARYQQQTMFGMSSLPKRLPIRRGWAFGAMIIGALLAFEMFNYSTTDFALNDLLGNLSFAGLRWSTILAVAFCGIDFAGIARLFTPEEGAEEPMEVWYLFGAWLLGATMNAMLTWWGVSIAILGHDTLGNAVIDRATLLKAVPIFVAMMVWLSRVLIIGTFSVAGERLFSQADQSVQTRGKNFRPRKQTYKQPAPRQRQNQRPLAAQPAFRPAPKSKPAARPEPSYGGQEPLAYSRSEPTYHPIGANSRNRAGESRNGGRNFR